MGGTLGEWTQRMHGDDPWWWATGTRHNLPRIVVVLPSGETRGGRPLWVAFITHWIGIAEIDALRVRLNPYATGVHGLQSNTSIERLLNDVRNYMEGV